jgi:hypothetical protein
MDIRHEPDRQARGEECTMSIKKTVETRPVKTGGGEVEVSIDEGKVREGAYLLSQQKKSYNDYIWLLAEADLKLVKAFPDGPSPLAGPTPRTVKVSLSKIIDAPLQSEIKQAAEALAKKAPKIQDLHWFIAIRNFIYQEAKKKK